jgi:predicted dehydrogenase
LPPSPILLRPQRSITGVPLAFSDAEKLAQHPNVDLVTVSVKVPDHYLPVMAAAGKHVFCEWPLGRDTDEATRMLAAAERKGIQHAVGLQGQMSPAINYTKDLIADGYGGRVLSATMIGCARTGEPRSTAVTRPISLTEPICWPLLAATRSTRSAIAWANFASLPRS